MPNRLSIIIANIYLLSIFYKQHQPINIIKIILENIFLSICDWELTRGGHRTGTEFTRNYIPWWIPFPQFNRHLLFLEFPCKLPNTLPRKFSCDFSWLALIWVGYKIQRNNSFSNLILLIRRFYQVKDVLF
jgi:hypothetical protein